MLREFTHCLQTKPHAHASTVEECIDVDRRDVMQFQSRDPFRPQHVDAPVQAPSVGRQLFLLVRKLLDQAPKVVIGKRGEIGHRFQFATSRLTARSSGQVKQNESCEGLIVRSWAAAVS